jgi:hypothetical protein
MLSGQIIGHIRFTISLQKNIPEYAFYIIGPGNARICLSDFVHKDLMHFFILNSQITHRHRRV